MSDIIEKIFGEDLKKAREEAEARGIKKGEALGIKKGQALGRDNINRKIREMLNNNCSLDDIRNFIDSELQKSSV